MALFSHSLVSFHSISEKGIFSWDGLALVELRLEKKIYHIDTSLYRSSARQKPMTLAIWPGCTRLKIDNTSIGPISLVVEG